MSDSQGDNILHKQHRGRNAGRKAEKKEVKNKRIDQLKDSKQKNPKAFTFNSAIKAERRFRRKQDIDTKKQHIPVVDRTPVEPPPILVAVVGPPKVGKSLVIQCLIKSFTKQPLTNINGPVTLISGKRRRITFMECNNDINSMIDIAKVADLVLLLIDASFGFEMEVFEFLNICQVHGMPRIMGVLTHLDKIKNNKQMRKIKKTLKQRFWTEVYSGAKLFYLSGLLHEEYLRMEIKNLARFISVMKFRPLTWRTTHPYMLVDRIEDLTDPELIRQNSKVDRLISLYGYMRGVPLNKQSSIHIPGCGDLKIKDISFLPDPCPLPEHLKKRALVERERLIYAPFSGVGGIVYDKDAVYVELGGSHSHKKDDTGLISQLLQTQETLDHKLEQSELQFFTDSAPVKSQDVEHVFVKETVDSSNRIRRKVIFNDAQNVNNDNLASVTDDESENEMDLDIDQNNLIDEDINKDNYSGKNSDASSEEGEEEKEFIESGDKIGQIRKRNETEELFRKKQKLDGSTVSKQDTETYCELHINQDKDINDKIKQALSLLNNESSKKSSDIKDSLQSDDESFDELSENENEDIKMEFDKGSSESEKDNEENESTSKKERKNIDDNESNESIKKKKECINANNKIISNNENDQTNLEDDNNQELKWKINIAQRAKDAFLHRQQKNINVMQTVYGVFDEKNLKQDCKKMLEEPYENIGGIFRMIQAKKNQKFDDCDLKNQEESIFFSNECVQDWLKEDNKGFIVNRFVTGKWTESTDAEELLKLGIKVFFNIHLKNIYFKKLYKSFLV